MKRFLQFSILLSFCSCQNASIEPEAFIDKNIRIGEEEIKLIFHDGSSEHDILFVNVHEDEYTSIHALWKFSELENVDFFYLSHSTARRISFTAENKAWTLDPNRIFSGEGIAMTLEDTVMKFPKTQNLVSDFTHDLLAEMEGYHWVVTVHNNTEENYGILSYLKDGSENKCTSLLNVEDNKDSDDFVYTTSSDLYNVLKAMNINVILQDNVNCTDDGSLSVFCGKNDINYVNIETQHGHLDEQLRLMQIVWKYITKDQFR